MMGEYMHLKLTLPGFVGFELSRSHNGSVDSHMLAYRVHWALFTIATPSSLFHFKWVLRNSNNVFDRFSLSIFNLSV